ncbi:MAG TPA: TonB-dependent receptor, partial [Planctomycetota bacterium]|nr:TonB-dependent receptor [Planctomycetota bacterium]
LYVNDDRNYSYLGVRGFLRPGDSNERVLVLVDGHAMNDAPFESSLIGREFGVDIEAVERIEVIRGPVSSLYGTNAVFGVVNIVTRSAPAPRHEDALGAGATFEADTRRAGKAGIVLDRFLGEDVYVLGSASGFYALGQSQEYPELEREGFPARTAPELDREQAENAFLKLAWGPLTLEGGINRRRKLIPTASYGATPHEEESALDGRQFAEARLELPLRDRLDVTARVYYDGSTFLSRLPFPPELGGRERLLARGETGGAEAVATARPVDGVRATVGADLRRNFDITFRLASEEGARKDEQTEFDSYAVFADAEVDLIPHITLTGGARYDRFETFGERASPRAALLVNPLAGTVLKLIYGEAFRAPSVYELYFTEAVGAPIVKHDLDPETVRHWEAEAEQELLDGRLRLALSYFRYDVKGLISAVPDGAGSIRYGNAEDVRGSGAEVGLDGRLPWRGVRGGLSYTFAEVVDDDSRERLSSSPQHLALARLMLPVHDDRVFVGVTGRFIGERPGLDGRPHAPAAGTVDLTVTWDDILPRLDLAAGVTDVADARWDAPGSFEHRQDL